MARHALLSASSAARWLNCPRSVRLTEDLPELGTSPYAAEGTLAHAIAETLLRGYLQDGNVENIQRHTDWSQSDYWYEGMIEDVMPYVEYVITAYETHGEAASLDLETRLDFSAYVPHGFGTGDAVIACDDVLEIVDLKFGKGVLVDADHNPQLMLYGLGALLAYDYIYDISTVRMTIVQPRLDHVTTFEMKATDLLDWAENTVKPIAKLAYEGKGGQNPGAWCRWCKLKATCKVRAESLLYFTDKRKNAVLSDAELSAILAQKDDIKRWLSDVEETVMERFARGEKLAGWKLVEGRSNRKIREPEKLAACLMEYYPSSEIYRPRELKTLTDLEKLVGKKRFAEEFGIFVEKPPGKPTLVPESDKRPALNSPEAEFEFEKTK